MTSKPLVYTIGYSGYGNNSELLIEELRKRNIGVLIDVRSEPYSATYDSFNKDKLSKALSEKGIIYRNYSKEFGAKQIKKEYYSVFDGVDNRIDYDIFTATDVFLDGVKKLETIIKMGYIPVIMCSEKDPLRCHRAIMISNNLFNKHNIEIIHIVPGKKDENQREFEQRMKNMIRTELKNKKKLNILEQKMKQEIDQPLFADDEYINNIQNYYRIMNSRIGWKLNEVLGYK